MGEFKFQNVLESSIEGIFDSINGYIQAIIFFFLKIPYLIIGAGFIGLRKMRIEYRDANGTHYGTTEDRNKEKINLEKVESAIRVFNDPKTMRPVPFMIVSFVIMLVLIRKVNFEDKVFAFNLNNIFNTKGILDTAKKLNAETFLLGLIPIIILLFYFIYSSILWGHLIFKKKLDENILRRYYSYMIGNIFLAFGASSWGWEFVIKPLKQMSWWIKWAQWPAQLVFLWPMWGMGASVALIIYEYSRQDTQGRKLGTIAVYTFVISLTILNLISLLITKRLSFMSAW